MGDQDPLLLAAREQAHPSVGKAPCAHGIEHLIHTLAPGPRGEGDAEPLAIDPQRHQVTAADGQVGVERELLRDVTDLTA
jgi:hypothetical protein